jgi:hypothetical protein
LINRRSNKKLKLKLLIYDLYLEVKSEDAESIPKIFNERYNTIQYNENIRNGNNINHALKKFGILSNYR